MNNDLTAVNENFQAQLINVRTGLAGADIRATQFLQPRPEGSGDGSRPAARPASSPARAAAVPSSGYEDDVQPNAETGPTGEEIPF